jgi:hypothetical protein
MLIKISMNVKIMRTLNTTLNVTYNNQYYFMKRLHDLFQTLRSSYGHYANKML